MTNDTFIGINKIIDRKESALQNKSFKVKC